MDPKNLFVELKRRNVHKVAIVYALIAWLLIQVAFIPAFEAPSWTIKTLIVLLVLGFVAVVFISWAFEATPEGMKRTQNVTPDAVLPTWSRRKFTIFIVAVAILAAGLHVFDLVRSRSKPAPSAPVASPPTAAP